MENQFTTMLKQILQPYFAATPREFFCFVKFILVKDFRLILQHLIVKTRKHADIAHMLIICAELLKETYNFLACREDYVANFISLIVSKTSPYNQTSITVLDSGKNC